MCGCLRVGHVIQHSLDRFFGTLDLNTSTHTSAGNEQLDEEETFLINIPTRILQSKRKEDRAVAIPV